MIEIKCYLEKLDSISLKDKETNKLVSIPSNSIHSINAWEIFCEFCYNYCYKVFDRDDKNNYILFIGNKENETLNEIILSPNSRYKLILEENYHKGINDKEAFDHINETASLDFILDKIYDTIKFIEEIEEKTNILLIGDRLSIELPIKEHLEICPFTYGSAMFRFSNWRHILYEQKYKTHIVKSNTKSSKHKKRKNKQKNRHKKK